MDRLEGRLEEAGQDRGAHEVWQLRGLCQRLEEPIRLGEDPPGSERRKVQLRSIVDEVAKRLVERGVFAIKGYRATPGTHSYRRYGTLSGHDNWFVEYDEQNAARFRESLLWGKTRAEAHAKLTKALSELHGGVAFDAENITFGEYLERWLNDSVRDSLKERTLMSYEQRVKKHLVPALGHLKLKKLTPAHLQAFYRSKLDEGLSAQSVLGMHTTTSGALKQVARWGLLRTNPASAVQPPRPKKAEITPLTQEQAKALLGAAQGSRLYALYALAPATGLRHGELLGLRWEDVEIKEGEGRLSVRRALVQSRPKASGGTGYAFGTPKTGRARVVSFGAKVAALLREHRKQQVKKLALGPRYEGTNLVFTDVEGGMLPPWKSGRIFNRLVHKLGLHGFRFHDLRHTAATLSLQESVHPRIVQVMLGHSKISQTLDTYSHVLPNMQAEAARRLDSALF